MPSGFLRGTSGGPAAGPELTLEQAAELAYGVSEVAGVQNTPAPSGYTNTGAVQRGTTARSEPLSDVIIDAYDTQYNPVGLSDLRDDSIVTIKGIGTMSYASAKTAGFVSGFDLASPVQQQAVPEAGPAPAKSQADGSEDQGDQSVADVPPENRMDSGAEESLQILDQYVHPAVRNALVEEAARNGELNPEMTRMLVQDIGSENVRQVRSGFEEQAKDALARYSGLGRNDVDDLLEVAYSEMPDLMTAAIRKQLSTRSVTGYEDVAVGALEHMISTGRAPVTLGEGVQLTKGRDGTLILHARGRAMSISQAIKNGVVRVSGA